MRDQVTDEKFGRLKRNLARVIDRSEDYSAIVELVQFSRVIIKPFSIIFDHQYIICAQIKELPVLTQYRKILEQSQ